MDDIVSLYDFTQVASMIMQAANHVAWVKAEVSEIMCKNGHYYITLIDKDENTGETTSQLRVNIWSFQAPALMGKFERATGSEIQKGHKILLKMQMVYHPVYGMQGKVFDIDPSFTLGEAERIRRETVKRLVAEGYMQMQKSNCELPTVIQKVAVISAAEAAGYGDFCKQVVQNAEGLYYELKLYAATMQGVNAPSSVVDALQRIMDDLEEGKEEFDCVVIIRGGGSKEDLACFDDYGLCTWIATFPLPVLTGIGHDRDTSIADMTAYMQLKTPTAVAQFLLSNNLQLYNKLALLRRELESIAKGALDVEREMLQHMRQTVINAANYRLQSMETQCENMLDSLKQSAGMLLRLKQQELLNMQQTIGGLVAQQLRSEQARLQSLQQVVETLNPMQTLKRGYTLTFAGGNIVTDVAQVKAGDTVVTATANGEIFSTVNKVKENK